jgi:hypothetical protein
MDNFYSRSVFFVKDAFFWLPRNDAQTWRRSSQAADNQEDAG